jgi:DNA-binding NarL/FixJ family response regulator
MSQTIRVLLVDDQIIIRQGLASLLETKSHIQVVGDADNGKTALEQVELLQPDIVLMDIRMPIMDGVTATQQISQRFPDVKVLVLTTFDDDEYVLQAMRCGARGYLLKDTLSDELAEAIRLVHKGHTHMGPGLFEKTLATSSTASPPIPPKFAELTPREREVLQLIAIGASNREIAEALSISERTVKNHMSNIFNRLDLRDRTQAALLASMFLPQLKNPQ